MRAAVLVSSGDPRKAFKMEERPDLTCGDNELVIQVATFGLNFADVMARLGLYQDCPPLPTIIGYEAVGTVTAIGKNIDHVSIGQRVLAFTRFGAYATQVVAQAEAVLALPNDISNAAATALATQYCTAYYAAHCVTNLLPGDHVLVQSAAGGVGTALVQLAKNAGCTVYGTAGSDAKLEYAKQQGVDVAINYKTHNFDKIITQTAPNGKVDVIFDAVGGDSVKKGWKVLGPGGRMVCYGAASMSGRKTNVFSKLGTVASFGIYHPVFLMMGSKSLLGVNMLRIADNKPQILQYCLQQVVAMAKAGKLKPVVGAEYNIDQLPEAHEHLEFRKSIGKIAVHW